MCVITGDTEIALLLINSGADCDIKDNVSIMHI